MLILGIDPGLQRTGFGVVSKNGSKNDYIDCGVIQTSSVQDLASRLLHIYSGLENIYAKYKPEVMVLEKLYAHHKHPTTLGVLGHVRGVICLLGAKNDMGVFEYPYTRIRKVSECILLN